MALNFSGQSLSIEGFFLLRSQNQNSEWMTKLEGIALDAATRSSCKLYDVEFLGTGGGRTLRIFIDKAEGQVGIEDCSNVSRALNEVLDADENLIPGGPYSLEVSSPGLDRDLRREEHFHLVVGKKIWVRLARPLSEVAPTVALVKTVQNSKQITTLLTASDEQGIELQLDAANSTDAEPPKVRIGWNDVEKGKLVFEFKSTDDETPNAKPKKKFKDHKKRVGK